jgi:hypothetical protein
MSRVKEILFPLYQKHSIPSVEAAIAQEPRSWTQRGKVLSLLRLHFRDTGATDEQMQEALDMNPSTQRPRRIELVSMGLVEDSGETRTTRSGSTATVWKAK